MCRALRLTLVWRLLGRVTVYMATARRSSSLEIIQSGAAPVVVSLSSKGHHGGISTRSLGSHRHFHACLSWHRHLHRRRQGGLTAHSSYSQIPTLPTPPTSRLGWSTLTRHASHQCASPLQGRRSIRSPRRRALPAVRRHSQATLNYCRHSAQAPLVRLAQIGCLAGPCSFHKRSAPPSRGR